MNTVKIERFAYSPIGTFGVLTTGDFKCFTVERPWADNKRRESCIPEGTYTLKLGMYNKGGYPAYEVMDVPDRSEIKIHIANTMDYVVGCIGLGRSLGWIKGKWAVTKSTVTLGEFMGYMDEVEEAEIIISTQLNGRI